MSDLFLSPPLVWIMTVQAKAEAWECWDGPSCAQRYEGRLQSISTLQTGRERERTSLMCPDVWTVFMFPWLCLVLYLLFVFLDVWRGASGDQEVEMWDSSLPGPSRLLARQNVAGGPQLGPTTLESFSAFSVDGLGQAETSTPPAAS